MDIRGELLRKHRDLILHDSNEASTRLKVVDTVLREVLGWLDDDIHPEEHVSEDGLTTYADYILRTANAAVVVEVKKAGSDFSHGINSSRRVKLTKALLESPMGRAIVQARDYARKLGVDFAVATNGSVWVVFPAQRHDQVKFQDSTALIFWSLSEILDEHYQEFYDLLGRDSVISGSLEQALLGRIGGQVDVRKLGSFFNAPVTAPRKNPVYPLMGQYISIAFSDSIVDLDHESFDRCYVPFNDSIKFDSKIKMVIAKRSSVVSGGVMRGMKSSDLTQIEGKIKGKIKGDSSSGLSPSKPLAMLVLGTVGSGKTTFVHHLRKVKLRSEFETSGDAPRPHWVHLDFLNKPGGTSASDFIYRSLLDYINGDEFLSSGERCVKKAYEAEIRALKSGPMFAISKSEDEVARRVTDLIMSDYAKVNPYVTKIIRFASSINPFFLIIDNVDQIEDDDLESRLFVDSLSISRALSLNLLLCLRQSTFARHRSSAAIDAFDFESILIESPIIASVLSKRFDLMRYLSKGQAGDFVAENGAKFMIDDLANIVDLLQGSVLGTEIGQRIEVLATEDVRLALRMSREFLERGYTNPGRGLDLFRRTGKYILPRHEAFRAIMLGTSPVYREDSSPIGNPFDSKLSSDNMQLLRLYVLSALVSYAGESDFRQVDGSVISESMRKVGIGDSYTERVLRDLTKLRFIFTSSHSEASLASSYIPSRLGGHVVRELICDFTYLENVMYDTYVASPSVWDSLRGYTQNIESERDVVSRLRSRVDRVRCFYNYMSDLYSMLPSEAKRRGLSNHWCQEVMGERRNDLEAALARVLDSGRRNYPSSSNKSLPPVHDAESDDFFEANYC